MKRRGPPKPPKMGDPIPFDVRGYEVKDPLHLAHLIALPVPPATLSATYHDATYVLITAMCPICCYVPDHSRAYVGHDEKQKAVDFGFSLALFAGFTRIGEQWVCPDCAEPPL